MSDQETIQQLENTLETLLGSHRNDLVIDTALKILTLDSQNFFASLVLIGAYNNTQNYEKMYEALQAALKNWPNEATVHYRLYLYYLALGDENYIKAKEAIETAIKLDPEHAHYYRELGEVYLINWEPDKAVPALETAVKLDPNNAEYKCRLALSLTRTNRVNEGLDLAKKALSEDPDNHSVLDTIGMIYILNGDLEKAEKFFRDALQRFPTYNYFQKHLDWVESEKTDKEKREREGKKYTPLYLRQKGKNRFF